MSINGKYFIPGDNAVAGLFLSTIKSECVHRKTSKNREKAHIEIFDYIERFCNKFRFHSALDYLSPMKCKDAYCSVLEVGSIVCLCC